MRNSGVSKFDAVYRQNSKVYKKMAVLKKSKNHITIKTSTKH